MSWGYCFSIKLYNLRLDEYQTWHAGITDEKNCAHLVAVGGKLVVNGGRTAGAERGCRQAGQP